MSGRLDATPGTAVQQGLGVSLLWCLGVATAYSAAGWLGLRLAIPPGYAAAIWPAAGIALAGVLLLGNRVWPGVLVGSFFVNVWTAYEASETFALLRSCSIAGAIALGAALQALLGAALIRRFVGFPTLLDRERDVVTFLALGGPVSCVVSPTLGAAILWTAGAVATGDLAFSWATWWVGNTIGALIVTPILLVLAGQPREAWRRRRLSAAVPLCMILVLTVVFFVTARVLERDHITLEYERRATVLAESLQSRVEADLEVLYALEGLFASGAEVDRASFRRFVEGFFARQSGLHAVSWNPWVPDEERSAVEAAARERHPGFQITDLSAAGTHVRSARAEAYVPVLYIEPLAANRQALGLNVNSHPVRSRALAAARDSGLATATPRIMLVQEKGDQAGILVFHPIYKPARPLDSIDARRRALQGFAVGVFLVGEMVEAALGSFDLDGIDIRLYDELGSDARELLYRRPAGGSKEAGIGSAAVVADPREIHWDKTFPVAGRAWRFTCHLTPAYLMAHRDWQAGAVLVVGLLLTTLLGALLLVLTGRSARHERLAHELSAANRDLQREMSERSRAEEELRRSQKLEAVGRLAGGIAHDFNNLLQVILSCSEETLRRLPPGSPERDDVEEVLRASEQGAQITRQLLALGRTQVLEAQVLDLNEFVERTATMLERIVGEEIELVLKLDPALGFVKLDPGQIEQVLLNLIVNARDAMPDGGRLEISTSAAGPARQREPSDGEARGREWIALAVSDTGTGLSPEARAHLFEPFFTTKDFGQGSGLGLSVVHGIVEQSGGQIQVDSNPGRGTTVRITFPRVEAERADREPPRAARGSTGSESILLVEDEAGVRRLLARSLRARGYDVTDVGIPTQALSIFNERGGAFDLVLTDVIMPEMNGRELARRLQRKRGDLKILFMSGYAEDIITRKGVLEPGTPCLKKPFAVEILCETIRGVLDAAPEP